MVTVERRNYMYPIWLKAFIPPYVLITIPIYLLILVLLTYIFKEKNIKLVNFVDLKGKRFYTNSEIKKRLNIK